MTSDKDRWLADPKLFQPGIESLWQTMNTGGNFGFERILQFNGSFFADATAFALPKAQLETLYEAAEKDWSEVEPAIFGTLLERALDKKERSRLGAHYTPRSYVERLVRPVVMEPLREEWLLVESEVDRLLMLKDGQEAPTKAQRQKAVDEIEAFLEKLRTVRILDPACGSGNFLYVTLDLLKTLEREVETRLLDVVGQREINLLEAFDPRLAGHKQVNPAQFLGIEINPRAAAIAELVIWIGYLQWHFKRYGTTPPPEPILQDFHNIEYRDAVLAYDGKEPDIDPKTGTVRTRWGGRKMKHPVTGEAVPDPNDQTPIYRYINPRPAEWQEADYIVSNPPFMGDKRMKNALGEGYVETLRLVHGDVPEMSDLVMYWWNYGAKLASTGKYKRLGFITTNSITQTFNRRVVHNNISNKQGVNLIFAIPDHPWDEDEKGAAVRISMTVFESKNRGSLFKKLGVVLNEIREITPEDSAQQTHIQWKDVGQIFDNLQAGVDLSNCPTLRANSEICNVGVALHGDGFTVAEAIAEHWIKSDKELREIVRPTLNGRDLTSRSRKQYLVDFFGLTREQASEFTIPYQWIVERVLPSRQVNNRKSYRDNWWIFGEARPQLRESLKGLPRYISTSLTAKHRVFCFLSEEILPDQTLVIFSLANAYYLGVLSSQIHSLWALVSGGTLEDRPRYNKTVCFDPFPFPAPTSEQEQKIRDLGERLDAHRKRVQVQHPDVTITGMYNLLEKLRKGEAFSESDRAYNDKALVSTLKQIHDDLDAAVLDAYGWQDLKDNGKMKDGIDEIILERLVTLNAERAEEERNGIIRWLRPDYQAPNEVQTQQVIAGVVEAEEAVIAPVEQKPFPKQPKEQLATIRDLLRTSGGEWTVVQIAAQFKGGGRYKGAIAENLERLEWFGVLLCREDGQTKRWQFAELQQSA
ncbi:MAG: class I SAM-dependent DNA methyltransferase [Stenomitos frigidus ULC029]